ncbi:MAG: hypothetical protein WBO95_18370, partial [Candidatus Dechloromonas phosphoritropha]
STPCMFVAYRSARAIANMIASSVIRQPSIVIPVWFRLVRLRFDNVAYGWQEAPKKGSFSGRSPQYNRR